jgi:Rad3-related DNA helicase
VLDECHNVIDMATEINSDRITPYSLRICLKDLEIFRSPSIMQRFVKILLSHLEKKKKSLSVTEIEIKAEDFLLQVYSRLGFSNLNDFKNLVRDLHTFSASIHDDKVANGDVSRDFVGALAEFWLKWIRCYLLDNYFFCYSLKRVREKPIISMEIVALDPRDIVTPILKECYTSVHLSGTVNPYVYNNLMGLRESGKSYKGIVANSPFQKENIKAIITEGSNV